MKREDPGVERQKSTVEWRLQLFAVLNIRLLNGDLPVYEYTGSMAGTLKKSVTSV